MGWRANTYKGNIAVQPNDIVLVVYYFDQESCIYNSSDPSTYILYTGTVKSIWLKGSDECCFINTTDSIPCANFKVWTGSKGRGRHRVVGVWEPGVNHGKAWRKNM